MDSSPTQTVVDPHASADQGRRHWVWWTVLLTLVVLPMVYAGFELRRWTFVQTTPIRFGDIYRGWKFGYRASTEGYLDLYDRVLAETRNGYNELDYAPLRLLAMKTWADFTLKSYPDAGNKWQRQYEFTQPVLRFNTCIELFGAVGMFLLVRHWAIRGASTSARGPPVGLSRIPLTYRADLIALLAAALLWFNPAMILSAHAWPTWDAWVPDFFIWAVLMASWRKFFWCGVIVAVGAMFKGQQWIVAPLFLLYPLFQRRWAEPIRFAIGAALAVMLVTSVWAIRVPVPEANITAALETGTRTDGWVLVSNIESWRNPSDAVINLRAVAWILLAAACGAVLVVRTYLKPMHGVPFLVAQGILAVLAAAFLLPHFTAAFLALVLLSALTLLQWPFGREWRWMILAVIVSGAIAACYPVFDASTGWYQIGWKYGSNHWVWLIVGRTSNLPGILYRSYKWDNEKDLLYVVFNFFGEPVTLRTILKITYAVGLGLAAWGAARFESANDKRFLLAVVAPWVVMFAFLGQMHERYLLFAAAVSCCFVVLGFGWTLMCMFWTVLTFMMTIHVMLLYPDAREMFGQGEILLTRQTANQWLKWIAPTHPDIGWAVIVSALVIVFAALARPRAEPKLPLEATAAKP